MFQIVAIPFDAFQSLPGTQHRWLLTCFSRYVDKAGKAFPSLRQLARDARMSLASVSRYMAALADQGVFHRKREPGGRYHYVLAETYRPRWPRKGNRGVSAPREGVSQAETQKAKPTKQAEKAQARFADWPDDRQQWEARLRSWHRSGGRFWNAFWGPKPSEPGCFAPAALLQTVT